MANEVRALSVNLTGFNNDIRKEISSAQIIIEKLKSSVNVMSSVDIISTLKAKERVSLMVAHVGEANIKTNTITEELAKLSPKIADSLGLGIRALQFEDLTYQILSSLEGNFLAINTINQHINKFKLVNTSSYKKFTGIATRMPKPYR